MRHIIRYQLPAILWALVIFMVSSIPASKLPPFALRLNDKFVHATIFVVFGLLVYRAFEFRIGKGSFDWGRAFLTVAAVTLYGVLDELHQSVVPGRTMDIGDAAADAAGGIVAAVILYLIYRRKGANFPQ